MRIAFDHVPKCGGTSINTALLRQPDCTVIGVSDHFDLAQGLLALDTPGLDNHVVLTGNHLHNAVPAIRDRIDFLFTFVREPYARFLSYHAFSRSMLRLPEDTSLEAYYETYPKNALSRFLEQEGRSAAQYLLEDCDAFGLVERFDDAMRGILHRLGMACDAGIRTNRTPRYHRDTSLRQRFLRDHAEDVALYEQAAAEFDKRCGPPAATGPAVRITRQSPDFRVGEESGGLRCGGVLLSCEADVLRFLSRTPDSRLDTRHVFYDFLVRKGFGRTAQRLLREASENTNVVNLSDAEILDTVHPGSTAAYRRLVRDLVASDPRIPERTSLYDRFLDSGRDGVDGGDGENGPDLKDLPRKNPRIGADTVARLAQSRGYTEASALVGRLFALTPALNEAREPLLLAVAALESGEEDALAGHLERIGELVRAGRLTQIQELAPYLKKHGRLAEADRLLTDAAARAVNTFSMVKELAQIVFLRGDVERALSLAADSDYDIDALLGEPEGEDLDTAMAGDVLVAVPAPTLAGHAILSRLARQGSRSVELAGPEGLRAFYAEAFPGLTYHVFQPGEEGRLAGVAARADTGLLLTSGDMTGYAHYLRLFAALPTTRDWRYGYEQMFSAGWRDRVIDISAVTGKERAWPPRGRHPGAGGSG